MKIKIGIYYLYSYTQHWIWICYNELFCVYDYKCRLVIFLLMIFTLKRTQRYGLNNELKRQLIFCYSSYIKVNRQMYVLKGLIDIRGIPEGYYHSYLLKLLIYINFIGQYCFSIIMFLTSYNLQTQSLCYALWKYVTRLQTPLRLFDNLAWITKFCAESNV